MNRNVSDKGADTIKKTAIELLYEFEKGGRKESGFVKSTIVTPFESDREQLEKQGYKFKGTLNTGKREGMNNNE